jgi:hypothetical protein
MLCEYLPRSYIKYQTKKSNPADTWRTSQVMSLVLVVLHLRPEVVVIVVHFETARPTVKDLKLFLRH